MSMIKCPECGKEFSDKAAACPNCGCPVSEAIKGLSTDAERKEATEKMLAAVDRVLEHSRKAGAKFEVDSDSTKRLANDLKINLNSSTAKDNVKLIVHLAVKACDALYDSYQTLAQKLDAECRPLLLKNPDSMAIRFVSGTIQWLNEESEIENNYAITFNGFDLGNAVKAKYNPSPANLLIQAFWQAEYEKAPRQAELEARWTAKLTEHKRLAQDEERLARRDGAPKVETYYTEQEKAELEVQKKLQAEEANQRDHEKKTLAQQLNSEKSRYTNEVKRWEKACKEIDAKRNAEIEKELETKEARLREQAEAKKAEAMKALEKEREKANTALEKAKTTLAGLGAFKFSEKKTQKALIADLTTNILPSFEQKKQEAEATCITEINSIPTKLQAERRTLETRFANQLPYPSKPCKSSALLDLERKEKQTKREERRRRIESRIMTPNQKEREYLKEEILDYLDGHSPMTPDAMAEMIPALRNETVQTVSSLCRALRLEGEIESITIERKTHFRIPE